MTTPHKATPAQWKHLENGAQADRPYQSARCLLELRDRITALEIQRETEKAAILEIYEKLDRLKLQHESNWARIVKLEAAQQQSVADDESQTLHTIALKMVDTLEQLKVLPEILDTLRRAIREPMEQPTPEAAPVATDAELRHVSDEHSLWSDIRRACYDLGREHGIAAAQPAPPAVPVPAGGLVERATEAILEAMLISDAAAAQAAINAVAEWFDTIGYGTTASILRQEVQRG